MKVHRRHHQQSQVPGIQHKRIVSDVRTTGINEDSIWQTESAQGRSHRRGGDNTSPFCCDSPTSIPYTPLPPPLLFQGRYRKSTQACNTTTTTPPLVQIRYTKKQPRVQHNGDGTSSIPRESTQKSNRVRNTTTIDTTRKQTHGHFHDAFAPHPS